MADQPLRDHFGLFELPDRDRTWVGQSACNGSSANFFPTKMGEAGVKEALTICNTCPVRVRCLQYAINNGITHGIWGGHTARGRREVANALAYLDDPTRIEHLTARWYHTYSLTTNDPDPVRRTAQTLGISKATVYHHLRVDRLAKEQTSEFTPESDTDRNH